MNKDLQYLIYNDDQDEDAVIDDTIDDGDPIREPEFKPLFAIANPKTYRTLPVEVRGVTWTGTNVHEMRDFVSKRDDGEWNFLTPVEVSGIIESSAIVWDSLHKGWIPVNIGDIILKGVSGEFYPVAEDVLKKTYEEVR